MLRTSRVFFKALACAAVLGGSWAGTAAHAADADATWQKVRAAGVLRCGAAASPPYVIRNATTGQYSGPFPVLCQEFGEKVLKVKVQFVDTNWDNIVAGLQSDKWDVSLSLNDTPERRKAISFTQPAIDYSVNFAYNKSNPKLGQITALADLDKPNLTIAVMSGTVQDKAISPIFKQARIMRLPGFDETRMALMSKRADLLADDTVSNALLTTTHPSWAVAFNPTPALAQQGINFGVRKQTAEADIEVFNKFLDEQKRNGRIDELLKLSIKESLAQTR